MDRIKFSPMADLLVLFVEKVPEIEAHIAKTYSAGSSERKAFEKINALVPDMDALLHRLVEVDAFGGVLTADEKRSLRNIGVAIKDAEAIMQEAGIAIEFTDLPRDFQGFE